MLNKQELRKYYQNVLKSLSQERRKEADLALSSFIPTLFSQLPEKGYVLSFAPLAFELDISMLNRMLAEQNRLSLCRCVGDHLIPCLASPIATLIKSELGVLQPPETAPVIPFEEIKIALVPALCFTDKFRLGRGKGFYDRLLPQLPHAKKIGMGFNEQYRSSLPTEEHDAPLDFCYLF